MPGISTKFDGPNTNGSAFILLTRFNKIILCDIDLFTPDLEN